MNDYRATYSSMTDDQLLNLALEADLLVPESKDAFDAELAFRKLGKQDISEQAEYLRTASIEALQRKPLRGTIYGFGLAVYGKRDFRPDESFVTTQWVVFFWIPLLPLRSLRIRRRPRGSSTEFFPWSRRYDVLEEFNPNVKQVLCVYAYVAPLVTRAWPIVESIETFALAPLAALVVWASVPWLLRRLAWLWPGSGS